MGDVSLCGCIFLSRTQVAIIAVLRFALVCSFARMPVGMDPIPSVFPPSLQRLYTFDGMQDTMVPVAQWKTLRHGGCDPSN